MIDGSQNVDWLPQTVSTAWNVVWLNSFWFGTAGHVEQVESSLIPPMVEELEFTGILYGYGVVQYFSTVVSELSHF